MILFTFAVIVIGSTMPFPKPPSRSATQANSLSLIAPIQKETLTVRPFAIEIARHHCACGKVPRQLGVLLGDAGPREFICGNCLLERIARQSGPQVVIAVTPMSPAGGARRNGQPQPISLPGALAEEPASLGASSFLAASDAPVPSEP